MTASHRPGWAALGASMLLACGQGRQMEKPLASATDGGVCSRCHGGTMASGPDTDPLIAAAPPRALGGDPASPAIGAHALHLRAHLSASGQPYPAVPCSSCHRLPDSPVHPTQTQGKLSFGGLATAAWPAQAAPAPVWTRATGTCSGTYCHGGFLRGNTANAPAWNAPRAESCGTCHALPPASPHPDAGASTTSCAECHPETVGADGFLIAAAAGGKHLSGRVEVKGHGSAWVDVASPGFHAFAANQGIAACQACHGLDLAGGSIALACATCHDGGSHLGTTVVAFQVGGATNCVACHGGGDNQSGAPPRATWGQGGDPIRAGAHTTHVAAGLDCALCHQKPTDLFSPGHVDGPTASVSFSGFALAGGASPSWDRGTARCSGVYCHGGTLQGGSNPAPDWRRVGQGETACGTCHGLPPASQPSAAHPVYLFAAPCQGCHPATATVDGAGNNTLVAGGPHVDGSVQATFGGHPAGWAVPWAGGGSGGLHSLQSCQGCGYIPGLFSMTDYYTLCTPCHGVGGDFSPSGGPARVSCGACHPAFFDPSGATSCGFCH